MVAIADLIAEFRKRYGKNPRVFRAPGRVNLIGEHTDYNEGFVLPIAIDLETTVAVASRSDLILSVWSANLDESIEIDLRCPGKGHSGGWRDYIDGVAMALAERGIAPAGADISIASDIPIGGGLASSAALETALAMALVSNSGGSMDRLSIALAGQSAEHRHVGIQCGIMDQFASAFALKDHAMLLDCRSLEAKMIPFRLPECGIVVCDTRVRHALASSEYNRRRQDCEFAVTKLRAVLPGISSLRDVTMQDLETHREHLPPDVLRRCRHVIGENDRTLKAARALESGDAASFGSLMSASHTSLKDDYEVSCSELDFLVAIALSQPGVLGARMTGGGFGGCTINLVDHQRIRAFQEAMACSYRDRFQKNAAIAVVQAAEGAGEVTTGFP